MSAAQHTPGPWEYTVEPNGDRLSIFAAGQIVVGGCGCCGSPWTDSKHAEANARLIAAAPEMYQLLLEAQSGAYDANSIDHANWLARVDAVIAAATGQSACPPHLIPNNNQSTPHPAGCMAKESESAAHPPPPAG